MPGYEVIGFAHDQKGANGWLWFDALHCRVRAVWDPEGLHMTHRRMDRTVAPADEHPIEVRIEARSRADLIADELNLWWRLGGQHEWRRVRLGASQDPGTFTASIPGAAEGETIEYFVSAADASGRRESLPRTAPDGFYTFAVSATSGS